MGFGRGSGRSATSGFGFGSGFGLGLGSGFGSGLEGVNSTAALTGNAGADTGGVSAADGVPDAPGAAAAAAVGGPGGINITVTGNGFGGAGGGDTANASNKPAALRCASADKPAIAACWPKEGRMIVAALRVLWIR